MVTFTFNTLDKLGVFGKFYLFVSNAINKNILSRNTLHPEFVSDLFNAVDGFWLKYNKSKWYNQSQLHVIVGMLASSLKDNDLSAKEVQVITNYVVANWNKKIAEEKGKSTSIETLLPSKAEKKALKLAKAYREVENTTPDVFDFVAKGASVIGDGSGSVLEILDLLKAK